MLIATEDSRFYEHHGIDPVGIFRAASVALFSGHASQGASTITQQLARNFFLSPERALMRKIKVNGVTLGSTYALIAIGYTMVYGIIGMINFAHGEVYMIGSYVSFMIIAALMMLGIDTGWLLVNLEIEPFDENRVKIKHKLSYVRPTNRGKISEEDTTETPMYVNRGGRLTILQEDQGQLRSAGISGLPF